MSKETITLDNFADFHGEVNGIEIQANLPFEPYVPSAEINVHLGRIARAARAGHLGTVAFQRYSKQTSVTPGVDSVSEDGSATASFSATASKAPRMESDITGGEDAIFGEGAGTIKINLGHDDLDEINLRQAQPWANYIDSTMRQGIRSCSTDKLLEKTGSRAFWASATMFWPAEQYLSHGLSSGVKDYLFRLAIYNTPIALVAKFKGNRSGEQTSLIPFLPIDRLSAVQAYTRTRKFVEVK